MHVPHHLGAIQLNPSTKKKCHLSAFTVCDGVCVEPGGRGGGVSSLLACWVSCFKMAARPARPRRLMASFQAGDSDRGLDRFFCLVGTIRNTKERPRLSVRCSFYYRLTPQTPAAQLAASQWRRFTALTTPALAPEQIVVQNTSVTLSHL